MERVRYFGDLDAAGVRIPRNAAATAVIEGLPAVTPALDLYQELLETSVRQGGQPSLTAQQAAGLVSWFDDESLAATVTDLLQDGVRIPQEAVTLTAMTGHTCWRDNL